MGRGAKAEAILAHASLPQKLKGTALHVSETAQHRQKTSSCNPKFNVEDDLQTDRTNYQRKWALNPLSLFKRGEAFQQIHISRALAASIEGNNVKVSTFTFPMQ